MVPQQTSEMVMRKAVTVKCDVEHAFRLFTEEIGSWWPLRTHSVTQERAETAVVEGRADGRLYERAGEEEHTWGTILAWEPPSRLRFSWHPGRGPDEATEVEVRFTAEGDSTRVELEHRGWERLGERAADVFKSYDQGWDYVLGERYGSAAA